VLSVNLAMSTGITVRREVSRLLDVAHVVGDVRPALRPVREPVAVHCLEKVETAGFVGRVAFVYRSPVFSVRDRAGTSSVDGDGCVAFREA